jgi:hypothetical protein
MKTIVATILMCLPLASLALDPATVTTTNFRGEAVSAASSEVVYRGETVMFTNCVAYSGSSTSSAAQNLTNLTVTLTWTDGTLASAVATGTVNNATSGIWSASVGIRTNEGAKTFFQLKLTDGTNTYVYPFRYLETKAKL